MLVISLLIKLSNAGLSNSDCKKSDQSKLETFSFCLIIISLELILELMVDKKIVNVIKKDAIVSIEVSGAYYHRVYDQVLRILDRQEDVRKSLENIDDPEQALTLDEAVVQTLMMLMKSVEDATQHDLANLTDEVELKAPEEPEEPAIDPS